MSKKTLDAFQREIDERLKGKTLLEQLIEIQIIEKELDVEMYKIEQEYKLALENYNKTMQEQRD